MSLDLWVDKERLLNTLERLYRVLLAVSTVY